MLISGHLCGEKGAEKERETIPTIPRVPEVRDPKPLFVNHPVSTTYAGSGWKQIATYI
jgi:hypothetical protein